MAIQNSNREITEQNKQKIKKTFKAMIKNKEKIICRKRKQI